MKTKTVAGAAILALVVIGFTTMAFVEPAFASQWNISGRAFASQVAPAKGHEGHEDRGGSHGDRGEDEDEHVRINLTVGQTLTFSNLVGRYRLASNSSVKGNATGSFTFTVTGVFREGFTFSLTSGTFTVGGKTYKVSGGSAQLGPNGRYINGQGTAGQGTSFLIRAVLNGNSTSAGRAVVALDVVSGSAEYLVMMRTLSS